MSSPVARAPQAGADGSQAWSVADLIRWATGYFTEKGISNARLETEWLLAHSLGLQRVDLYVQHDRPLSPTELSQFKELVKRRSAGEPFQYILGLAPFYGRDFRVTPDVLIPRPETETLIRVLQRPTSDQIAAERHIPPGSILDIGTGSGCLAVTAGLLYPRAQVLALDSSPRALAVAEANARTLGAANVTFRQLDILNEVPAPFDRAQGDGFDVILCNPPYIAAEEVPTLEREIREHEPQGALTDGADGLTFFRRLAEVGPRLLQPGGRLIMEIGGDPQTGPVRELFERAGFSVALHEDMQGAARVCEAWS